MIRHAIFIRLHGIRIAVTGKQLAGSALSVSRNDDQETTVSVHF